MLDVGCAAGYFLNAARLHFDPVGIEPSRKAADFARSQLKLNVQQGALAEAAFADNSFDVVTLSDVIEHLPDPAAELREIHRITRPGGLLYVMTPNIASLAARLLGSKWWGLRPAHVYYFSPATLSDMVRKAGFDVVSVKTYGRVFRTAYWASRLKNYSSWVTRLINAGIHSARIHEKLIYINTFDSIELCARKRSPSS
jgi:2-polyprenyl-3-methyl-5-hydroxy-6-metoxy-1,4-benzoquinol methylase